jgi:D-alanine transaminase
MEPLANLNGAVLPLADVRIPALDRGFMFGDAVYEVLRIYRGKPWMFSEHWHRLARNIETIRIPRIDLDRLETRLRATIAAGPFLEATAYIQITRGSAPRSHPFPRDATPLELLFVQEFHDPHREHREKGTSVITWPDLRWERCDIKSTNLLANVLAAQAAQEAGCIEALLYQPNGTLTEASHSSFFAVLDGAVLTTPSSHAILPGITRDLVISLCARVDIPVRERSLRREDFERVSELFLTGTTTEVLPIVRVDGETIADGKPGPITLRLQRAYQEKLKEFLEK